MGMMSSRRVVRTAWVLVGVLVLAAAIDAAQLVRDHRRNAQIAAGVASAEADAPAPLRFAHAFTLAASGAGDAAVQRYGALQDDPALGQAARYNAANLLMRQAIVLRAGPQPGQALAFVELAKEHYREVLRRDPGHWDARYNLERAQRLVPDPDEAEAEPAAAQRNAERAVTTMRGFSPGLP